MKMIYLVNHQVIEAHHMGIRKKFFMQMKAFEKNGYQPVFIITDEFRVFIQDKKSEINVLKYFPGPKESYQYIYNFICQQKADLIYIRYPVFKNRYMFNFYKSLNVQELADKIVYEFYTYPYDKEFDKNDIAIKIDSHYAAKLKQFVKYSTNFTGDNEIYGIPSIFLINGVDTDLIPVIEKRIKNKKEINLVGIGLLSFRHAYHRIIEGLHEYYNKNKALEYNIRFHIIGEGKTSFLLRSLVKKYGLEKKVIFYGIINNEHKIQEIMNHMDIGVSALAMSKYGMQTASPIKASEYCSRGLPIIVEEQKKSIFKGCSFALNVTCEDEPIDMEQVIEFYNNHCDYDTALAVREFAKDNLSWNSIISNLLKEIYK